MDSKRREVLVPEPPPKPLGPYSQGVRSGRWVFTSGTIGNDPATGMLVPGGVAAETRQGLTHLGGAPARRQPVAAPGRQDYRLPRRPRAVCGDERRLCRVLPPRPSGSLDDSGRRAARRGRRRDRGGGGRPRNPRRLSPPGAKGPAPPPPGGRKP